MPGAPYPEQSAKPSGLALNLCDTSPWLIASEEFNANPTPIQIAGVRTANRGFFAKLRDTDDPQQRGQLFHDYLAVTFGLHLWEQYAGKARSSLRNSYFRYLRGWEVDSNREAAAVLKSWVQSRFGIGPTYHRGRLTNDHDGAEDARFAYDRMKGLAMTNAIYSQLDLLYEYCQYELDRRWPGQLHWELYRGTNDPEEHPVIDRRGKRESCVRLNNLVSFTSDREKAWEFGSTVWKSQIPFCKIVFFSGLLPDSLLKGEDEYLVIGGHYWVKELLF
ncbi:NAD(+)--dinitrogen-reductase ADP-D-ribosyltransferase [Cerasicoccus frondis]|uniref:NAD(+)--dinitrogen-reductase ADP-D-ribosyltransferase n=1 Tax=Cerasicoccus frondis TaxID=490090 RepID=UPI002852C584|nr:NAD(+)--dinitrogen-reductase ADP-D-ribosyltransferase [Cerasicoccus frondis]